MTTRIDGSTLDADAPIPPPERESLRRIAEAVCDVIVQNTELRDLLAATTRQAPPAAHPQAPLEPLRGSELRVLRYLATHLTAAEIASELCVSVNTVKTHMRNLYAKLDTHRRTETVERARDLGLLARSAIGPLPSVP
jgi:DNA-binding NarL/FixJ family response regulator